MIQWPLSFTQRYFYRQIAAEGFDPSWQHLQVGVALDHAIDPRLVEEAVRGLEVRHPVLTARLVHRDGRAEMALDAPSSRALRRVDLLDARADQVDLWIAMATEEPFDLLNGPLWRVLLAHGPHDRTTLQLVAHHLIADGVSMWLLLRDIGRLIAGLEIEPPTAGYEEFVQREHELLDSAEGERRLDAWRAALADADPGLPLAEIRRPGRIGMTESLAAPFVPGLGETVMRAARRARVIPLAVVLAAVGTTIRRVLPQDDLLIATISDVRGLRFARTVGTFSELMLVRDPPDGERSADRRLVDLRNALFQGWKTHLPIEHLRERLPALATRGAAANPCEVFLNFVPATRAAVWREIVAPFGDPGPRYYAPPGRAGSPARRQLAPWFSFTAVHAGDLAANVTVHRDPALTERNRLIADGLPGAIAATADGGDRTSAPAG